MAKTKHEQGLCTLKGCKEKVSGHHAQCDTHRRKAFLRGPSQVTFEQTQRRRAVEAEKRRAAARKTAKG